MSDAKHPLDRLRAHLDPAALRALDTVVALARERGLAPYLVGGPVRDLLLGRPPGDLDIVVEGDAIALARAAGRTLGLRPRLHEPFGTATLRVDGATIDLVTARRERYPQPAALPVVEPATLRDDLLRRDFTIHAMAMALDGPDAGAVIDPTGGRDDLARRLVRVLHDASFIDDPTRLLRAVRYAARLGFAIEPHTRALAQRDRGGLARLTPARLRHEFDRMLAEEEPERALALAADIGLFAAIHPAFALPPGYATAFAELRQPAPADERAGVGWAILGAGLAPNVAPALARRLGLPKGDRAALTGAASLAAMRHLATAAPSGVANAAAAFVPAAVWGAALAAPDAALRESLLRHLRQGRYVEPILSPSQLLALGVPEGPLVGRIAAALRDAKCDGLVSTRDDELALVQRMSASLRGDPAP